MPIKAAREPAYIMRSTLSSILSHSQSCPQSMLDVRMNPMIPPPAQMPFRVLTVADQDALLYIGYKGAVRN